jgi:hypothetical protein
LIRLAMRSCLKYDSHRASHVIINTVSYFLLVKDV